MSRILEKEFGKKNISEVKANIRGPVITHVIYADDIILFLTACRKDALAISECLDKYYTWLDQLINRGRFGIFFSKATQKQSSKIIKQAMQMKSLKKDSVYLGAPLFMSKAPTIDFKYLDRLETRLRGWRSKSLS